MRWRLFGGLAVAVVLGWTVWWVVGSHLKTSALEGWLADRRAEGWVAEAASIRTAGFPLRFDTTIEALSLADTRRGWAWRVPAIDIAMLAYQPNAARVTLSSGQQIAVPGGRARLDAAALGAAIRFVPGPALEIAEATAEAADLSLVDATAPAAQPLATARILAFRLRALARGTAPPNSFALHVEADTVRLPDGLLALIDPVNALGPVADRLEIDGRVAFDAPLDRRVVEATTPGLTHLALSTATLRWGQLSIAVSGTLRADDRGFAEGSLDLQAENWREILAALVRGGVIGEELAATLRFGLGFFAQERGGRSVLSVPLGFSGGAMRIGPIPLGAAPRLRVP